MSGRYIDGNIFFIFPNQIFTESATLADYNKGYIFCLALDLDMSRFYST